MKNKTLESILKSMKLLTRKQQHKYLLVLAAQFLTSLLDLLAIGALGVLSIAVISTEKSERVYLISDFLDFISRYVPDEKNIFVFLGAVTVLSFLFKSLLSLLISRKVLRFLSARAVELSHQFFVRFSRQPLTFIQQKSSQEIVVGINSGVTAAMVGVLGSTTLLCTEIGLLVILAAGLILINPALTLISLFYFWLVFFSLQHFLVRASVRAGMDRTTSEIASSTTIQEWLVSFREVYISNGIDFTLSEFLQSRKIAAKSTADIQWMGIVPKYVMEFALILGSALLATYYFAFSDSSSALGGLSIFLAAGSRILPSILRIQGALSALHFSLGSSDYAFRLFDELSNQEKEKPRLNIEVPEISNGLEFLPELELKSINFRYPDSDCDALSDVSLKIPIGSMVAIVGPSGAGKSTLADLMLGLLSPQTGSVTLSGLNPSSAIVKWPGKIGYVPQHVALLNKSIRENVAIAQEVNCFDDDSFWNALERAYLGNVFRSSSDGLNTFIGERGVRLSGGQRQRLGLARALFSNPTLLILDEATSALDAESEHIISQTFRALSREVTLIVIAHRLATVRSADIVFYLEGGRLIAEGTFEEVRKLVPNFDFQANLLGL
jgi:ABC-type bacteriocin/lantibiotic exporter with double-glycine peptidase domain